MADLSAVPTPLELDIAAKNLTKIAAFAATIPVDDFYGMFIGLGLNNLVLPALHAQAKE